MAEMREVDVTINQDKISKLPNNLIESILERISIKESARTSILSTKWRFIWTKMPKLVLDKQFLEGLSQFKRIESSRFVHVVDTILMLHNAPIQEFKINIPFSQTPNMDLWILYLSRNGIKELSLFNCYHLQSFKLPSYIFSCDQLTQLRLFNCLLNTPLHCTAFSNLRELSLVCTFLSTNTGSLISTLLSLVTLSLWFCTGLENINNVPPNLSTFMLFDSHELQWQWFQSNTELSDLQLFLCQKLKNVEVQGKDFKLNYFLSSLPNLSVLAMDGFALEFFSAGGFTEFPQLSHKLKKITLTSLLFNDLDQVSCTFCFLKNSPSLEQLEIKASSDFFNDCIEQHDLSHIVGLADSDLKLNRLRRVKLSCFNGYKAELDLIKLILSHSPILRQMEIESSDFIAADKELAILIQLLSFCRASVESKIIFTRSRD